VDVLNSGANGVPKATPGRLNVVVSGSFKNGYAGYHGLNQG